MTRREAMEAALLALAGCAAGALAEPAGAAQAAKDGQSKVTLLLRKPLAGVERKEVTVVAVDYPPGTSSPKHRHPGPVFGYVAEGAVVFQIDDGPLVTHRKGDNFYEEPGHVHSVSRNASDTEPARIVAILIADRGAAPATPVT